MRIQPAASLLIIASLLAPSLAAAQDAAAPEPHPMQISSGPFEPTLESFAQNYRYPDWFRNAKLGLWSHWGPQAVPMMGDWYARHMYVQGHKQYQHHLETYGHPSEHGFKDIIPLWKAEHFDADTLMSLYKKAGARYFVSMGVHHDNFDLWDSKHNKWNAVNLGPQRDIVGEWKAAANKHGLRFGVSEHLGASFTWWQHSHGADNEGPKAGVPYDGADPRYEDLYHWPAKPGDDKWYTTDPRWHAHWFDRMKDLLDRYEPDLLYTDGPMPFGAVGHHLVAHFYNSAADRNGGQADAVYNCKEESRGRWVQDVERGVMPGISPHPWQTDTSIGDWYYNKNWKYRGADWVIHMLVDVVSKNGNLLLNVVQRPDGSLDPEAQQTLEELAAWMAVNGEAIYETRPWMTFGEGAVRAGGGHFKEDFAYTANDIRFTTRGDDTLYAIALGWPSEGKLTIRALAAAANSTGVIENITLLGHDGDLRWTRDESGVTVQLPPRQPSQYAVTLKITGSNLRAFEVPGDVEPPAIFALPSGEYSLAADAATLHGDGLAIENYAGHSSVGYWADPGASISWKVNFNRKQRFRVVAEIATIYDAAEIAIDIAGQTLRAKAPSTGAWEKFTEVEFGTVDVQQGDNQSVTLRPAEPAAWKPVNVRNVRLLW